MSIADFEVLAVDADRESRLCEKLGRLGGANEDKDRMLPLLGFVGVASTTSSPLSLSFIEVKGFLLIEFGTANGNSSLRELGRLANSGDGGGKSRGCGLFNQVRDREGGRDGVSATLNSFVSLGGWACGATGAVFGKPEDRGLVAESGTRPALEAGIISCELFWGVVLLFATDLGAASMSL